jgi:hypothetical protein
MGGAVRGYCPHERRWGGGREGRTEDGGWEGGRAARTGGSWTGEAHWSHGEQGGVCPPSSRSDVDSPRGQHKHDPARPSPRPTVM